MEEKLSFTWIPFYTEMAEKLLEYKDNRKELVKIVYGMDRQFVNYIKDDDGNDYPDIDPFSVFAIFNRSPKEERRKEICKYFKNVLQLDSNIPEDFDSIPLMDPRLSVFVWKGDISTGTQPIWDLYETVFEKKFDNEKFSNHFNVVRNQKGIKWTLTMALYWIRPYEFMPLDSNSREYLQKIGINVFDEKDLNGQNYLDLCKIIKEKIANNEIREKSIPEISNNAWIEAHQGDSQMAQEDTLVKKYASLLKNTKNLILTGAPGTGKTYLAKQIAKAMESEGDEIGFVQFHPSYDYTDFVEGLRPKQNGDQIGFERMDGVFKKFCEKALKNLVDSRKTVEEQKADNYFEKVYSMLINDIEEGICSLYKTAKGDFSVSIHENGNLCFEQNNPKKIYVKKDYLEILFNVIKDDNDLDIKNISREDMDKLVGDNVKTISHVDYIQYRWALNQLLERYKQIKNTYTSEITEKIQAKNFVFIIDEINRGEVAKIFGELFYSVDPGYRVTSDDLNAIKNSNKTITTIKTQYANLETEGNEFDKVLQKKEKDFGHFFIPENVYIIGTMNDIDRSVESMDFAFRRRFSWIEVKADDTQYMLDAELDAVLAKEAKRRMDNLNAAISKLPDLNDAYHIGASYFLKLKNYESDSDNGFQSLWNYHLKGILEEYLRGNPDKDKYLKQLENAYNGESDKTSNQQ